MRYAKFLLAIVFISSLIYFSIGGIQNVAGLQVAPQIIITLNNQTPDPVEANGVVELKFNVRNGGSENVNDLAVRINPEYPFALLDSSVVELQNLVGRQTKSEGKTVVFKVKVSTDAPEGDHKISLSYRLDNKWVNTEDFIVRIQTKDAIISIDKVSVIPEIVAPGQIFKFKLGVKNFADSVLKDVRVKLNFTDNSISTFQESNEKVIKYMNPFETVELEYRLISRGTIGSAIIPIPFEIRYVDNLGRSFIRDSEAGVLIHDTPKFLVKLDNTDVLTEGDKGVSVISFYNIGTGDIKFVTMELLENIDYEILSPKVVYLGNVESDDFESADYNIYVRDMKKEIEFNVLLKFRDNYNAEYAEKRTIPLKLYSEQDIVKYQLKKVGGGLTQIIIGMIGVLIIAFWLAMIYDCYQSKMSKQRKVVWCLLLLLSTIFGAVAYFFIARRRIE